MTAEPRIIVVTGVQAAGKTAVGRMLAERFERGVFIEADALQRMVVSGGVWVTDEGDPGVPKGEASRQLRLRLRNACLLARSFHEAGFTAVVDDIIIGERWHNLCKELSGVPFHLVVLAPNLATIEARDAARDKLIGGGWAAYLDGELRATMSAHGVWVDSSGQTPEETVDEVLRRVWDEGLVDS